MTLSPGLSCASLLLDAPEVSARKADNKNTSNYSPKSLWVCLQWNASDALKQRPEGRQEQVALSAHGPLMAQVQRLEAQHMSTKMEAHTAPSPKLT